MRHRQYADDHPRRAVEGPQRPIRDAAAKLLGLLRQWWKVRPKWYDIGIAPEQRWLFPGRNRHQPLTTRQFGRLFKEATKAAGLRKTLSLHSLRHSFATHLLERGKDIRVFAALLGHARVDTTAKYAQVAPRLIAATPSPIDQLSVEAMKLSGDAMMPAR